MSELRTVKLFGELGRRFGRIHRLAIASPAEAVRALCAICPGFERHVVESDQRGLAYKVVNSGAPIAEASQLHLPTGERGEVRIIPVVRGAKNGGLFQVILGAALIAVSFIPGLNVAIWTGYSATYASVAFSVGVSMLLGGVAQMLTPTPSAQQPQESGNNPSTQFNGAVNTVSQGQAVPVGYGRLIVGSAVLSAGVRAEGAPV